MHMYKSKQNWMLSENGIFVGYDENSSVYLMFFKKCNNQENTSSKIYWPIEKWII